MAWFERHKASFIILLVAVIAVGLAVFLFRWSSLPGSTEIVISTPSPGICVYVEGEVVSPGVYELNGGDLVEDAVEAAGGFTSDADPGSVNLAGTLRDGDHVRVYSAGEVPQRVNINTAETWLLEALPGIGEVMAQRIVDYRAENGPFQHIDDLMKVEGIGAAVFDKLKGNITVD